MLTAIPFTLYSTMLACLLFATPLQASGSTVEAWVSGTSGNDSNAATSCQRPAPCATLSAALSVTGVGGTVYCADPAMTFGPLSISQDVTIDCISGGAVTLTCLGGNGITINTAGISVTIRGLTINAPECSISPIGIDITAAALVRLEHCNIFGFSLAGVEVEPSVGIVEIKIQDSTITKNGSGILIAPSGLSVVMSVERSQIENNTGGGLKATTANGGPIAVSISDSSISQNGSNGVNAVGGIFGNVIVNLTRDVIASNGLAGLQANGNSAALAVDNTSILNNGSALSSVSTGRLLSYSTNRIVGTPGSGFTGSLSLQ